MIMLGERNDNLLQYYCLEGPMDRAAWQAAVHRVAKIWTQLSMLTCNENNVKHLFIYWLAIHISSLETVYPGPLPIFIFNCFLLLSCMNSLYILDINPLSIYCSQILLPNHSLAFHLAVPFIINQVALVVKNPSANAGDARDMGSSLGQEDPLEKGMATHSSILAWRISWTEEPGGL